MNVICVIVVTTQIIGSNRETCFAIGSLKAHRQENFPGLVRSEHGPLAAESIIDGNRPEPYIRSVLVEYQYGGQIWRFCKIPFSFREYFTHFERFKFI